MTKAAIEDVITRGDIHAWRGLVRAMRADGTGRIARRVRDLATTLSKSDLKAHSFAVLLPEVLGAPSAQGNAHD